MKGLTKYEVEYRKNNDVMFSIDDPFALNNKEVKQILKKKEKTIMARGREYLKVNGVKKTFLKLVRVFKK